jgi:hypothetical protein
MLASRTTSPALGGRAAEAGPVEVPGGEGQLGVALAQDRLDRRQVEHGGLQAGDGPGEGGGVGAGPAADVQQPARTLEAGQAGQLTPEPGGQVVEGAQEVERAAGVGGQAVAPGRDAGVAVVDALGQAGPGLVEEPLLGHDQGHRLGVAAGQGGPVGRQGVPGRAVAGQAERDQPPEQRPGRARAGPAGGGHRLRGPRLGGDGVGHPAATTADCW